MKRVLTAAAALVFLAGSALAAPAHDAGASNDSRPAHRTGSATTPAKPPSPPAKTQRRSSAQTQARTRTAPPPTPQARRRAAPAQQAMRNPVPTREARRFDWNTYRPGVQPPLWDRYRRNFNIHVYQRNYVSERRYPFRPYVRPSGYFYQRWVFGQIFPRIFWVQEYWIMDYWMYGLIDPPYGFVWVRYDGDAILVSVQTGLIIRVAYNVFY